MVPFFLKFGYHTLSYLHSIITVALFCMVSKILIQDICQKWRFFHTPCIRRPPNGSPRRNIALTFGSEKTRMVWLPNSEQPLMICTTFSRFNTIPACDRHTDRQMDRQTDVLHAMQWITSHSKNGDISETVQSRHEVKLTMDGQDGQ